MVADTMASDLTVKSHWLLPFVLLGCSSSVGSGSAPDAATTDSSKGGHDGGSHADAGPGDAAGPDAKGHDGAASEGASPDVCAQCVSMRCDSSATACEASASCTTEADCIAKCGTMACVTACEASDPGDSNAATDLALCKTGACILPCLDGGGDAGQMCAQLGMPCDPLVPAFSCCAEQGTCAPPTSSNPESMCCNAVGGSCDMGAVNPSADCCPSPSGDPGTCVGGKCAATTTCWPTVGSCNPTLPCCDSRLTCTSLGGIAGDECCAANGTTLPASDASLCCSHGISSNPDGSVTCVAAPMP